MSLPLIDMGNIHEEFFSLRWNSYGKALIESTANLLCNSKFQDVTLACEGKTIRCHRFILASFSPCLAQMLEEHPSSDPVIYLGNGIRFCVLKTLVSFMYCGEVQVDQSGLAELLKAAEDLKVRGLSTSSTKPKRRVDGEEVVNDDQENFRGIDLTKNVEVAGVSVNSHSAVTRTPSPFGSDEEQEQGPQNMVVGVGDAKDEQHGQENCTEDGGTGVGVRIDNEEEAGNDSAPEVNDDNLVGNLPGTSSGVVENFWKSSPENSRTGIENCPKKSRRKRKAVLKTLEKAKQSSSATAIESFSGKKKAKKQRTMKLATETSYYGGIMKQALERVSAGERISKVAIEVGIPVSTLCKYVKHPDKLKTSRIYAYVPEEKVLNQ